MPWKNLRPHQPNYLFICACSSVKSKSQTSWLRTTKTSIGNLKRFLIFARQIIALPGENICQKINLFYVYCYRVRKILYVTEAKIICHEYSEPLIPAPPAVPLRPTSPGAEDVAEANFGDTGPSGNLSESTGQMSRTEDCEEDSTDQKLSDNQTQVNFWKIFPSLSHNLT